MQTVALPRVRYPLGVRLVSIVTALLVVVLSSITALSSYLTSEDVRLIAEDSNYTFNHRAVDEARRTLYGVMTASQNHLDMLDLLETGDAKTFSLYFFAHNRDMAAILETDRETGKTVRTLVNQVFFNSRNRENPPLEGVGEALIRSHRDSLLMGDPRRASVFNVFGEFNTPLLAMVFHNEDSSVIVLFAPDSLLAVFYSGTSVSYMINHFGDMLFHPNRPEYQDMADGSTRNFDLNILSSDRTSYQTLFTAGDGLRYFSAYEKIPDFGAAVVTTVSYDVVFSGSKLAIQRNVLAGAIVLIFSILVVYLFSCTITGPLITLSTAARSIAEGTYDVSLPPVRSDEIGMLSAGFRDMISAQRNLERFSNKMILRLARSGRLKRSGVSRTITVSFTCIRDFHKIWGNAAAEDMVAFVNDYLSCIVPCITSTGGIVDKFLTQNGVIVMALWGTASDTDRGDAVSAETNALACLKAALKMRRAVKAFNAGHRSAGAPAVKIGCGINSGDVVEGQIGSEERMEYTVIGDTVNMASRIEGPNDLFDTDILMTEEVQSLADSEFVTAEMPALMIKGKADIHVRTFALINSRADIAEGGPATLEALRSYWNGGEIP